MKYSELEKILVKNGCVIKREGKNHCIWYSPITNQSFPVGRHRSQDVPTGTYKSIMRSAGIK